MKQPLLSIIILTYNHENYIVQSIESVLSQKVDFYYEIILSNDRSTDGTDAICQQYAKDNPCIHYINHEQNMGLTANHCWSVKQAKGKYITYCDGDDYWTDVYKLQKQVDYMEAHPKCSLCYHNVIVDNGKDRWLFIPLTKKSGFVEIEEIVAHWAIPTSAVLYRREYIKGEADIVIRYPNEDYAVELFMKSKGECYYDSSIGAVYRRHAASVSSGMNANAIKMYTEIIRLLEDAKFWFPEESRDCFTQAIDKYQQTIGTIQKFTKYPFLKYLKRNTYRRWLLSVLCK